MCGSDIFLGIIAILFPPLAVWVKRGICSVDSLINIALCCLGFLPGLLHAWYIISISPEPTYTQVPDSEQGNVTYYYVHTEPQYGPVSAPGQQGYGAVGTSAQPQAASSEEVPPTYQQAIGDNKKVQKPQPA